METEFIARKFIMNRYQEIMICNVKGKVNIILFSKKRRSFIEGIELSSIDLSEKNVNYEC
jgi:hypothetical protein